MDTIDKKFQCQFESVRADTPLLLDEALRLRYQVYCLENSFEKQTNFPDGREYDNYDLKSLHTIIRHRKTGLVAANTRLILPGSKRKGFNFPIQRVVPHEVLFEVARLENESIEEYAEISRFCISKDFIRRLCTQSANESDPSGLTLLNGAGVRKPVKVGNDRQQKKRSALHITVALFASIYEMSAEEGIKNWFAIMEPSLLRLLRRFGIDFTPVGGVIEYNGLRQPCYANADEVALGIWQKCPEIWRYVSRDGAVWPLPRQYNFKLFSVG